MIKFFRKFRQEQLANNKITKYLLYAAGEIILVVIGILIAISLNNNNQQQTAKIDRDTKLTKLRQVIYQDSIAFSRSISNSRAISNQLDELLKLLNKDMSFSDYKLFVEGYQSVSFQFRTFEPNATVYNELINSASFSQIENVELKDKISNLYSYYDHFGHLIENFTNGFIMTNNQLYGDGIVAYKYFNIDQTDESMQSGYSEFKSLLKDTERLRILENYMYSQQDLHLTIANLYSSIIAYFMSGLPLPPNEK